MSLRHRVDRRAPSWAETTDDPKVLQCAFELREFLPGEKNAAILDIGFGTGWFLAACLSLGYGNLFGADFEVASKAYVKDWSPEAITLTDIPTDIGSFLAGQEATFDFIHMSHVIEHVPKYSLLWAVDALYRALKPGGVLMLRTPNMEGPCASSSLYVVLAHEYGFSSGNLESLLDICGVDEIRFHTLPIHNASVKQKLGSLARWPFLKQSQIRHRLFGVNEHGHLDSELIATARRGAFPPFFDPRYR
jgi:SAM-dependent methyltransferase